MGPHNVAHYLHPPKCHSRSQSYQVALSSSALNQATLHTKSIQPGHHETLNRIKMLSLIVPLISLFSAILATPTPQGGPFSGPCGIPFLDSLSCINGGIVGSNLPIKDLTCKFTLAATSMGGPNTPYAIDGSGPSDPPIIGFGIAGQTLDFEIHKGVISSLYPFGGDGVLRATPAGGSSEKFSIVDEAGIVPELAMKYKCLKGLPTLVVVPEAGEYFAIDPRDKGTYDEGSWYSAALGQDDPFHTFKEIDVVVNLIYT